MALRYQKELMKREPIQAKFKATAERVRHVAVATLKGMIEVYPWLRDYARLLGLSIVPGLTREFPWLAPAAKASAAKLAVQMPQDAPGLARRYPRSHPKSRSLVLARHG